MPDFGIGEAIAALAGGISDVAAGIGVTGTILGTDAAALAGTVGADALIGAGGGALLGGITGTDPGQGALLGALTGGGIGFGGAVGPALGLGAAGGDILGGAAAGALGSGITGGNPLTGALTGAASGGLAGLSSGAFDAAAPTGAATASGTSSAAAAPVPGAAASTLGGGTGDLTSGGTGNFGLLAPATPVAPGGSADITQFASTGAGGAGSFDQGTLLGRAGVLAGGQGVPAVDPTNAVGSAADSAASLDKLAATYGVGGASGTEGGNSILNAVHDPTWGNIGKAVSNNAGAVVAGGGLLRNLLTPNSIPGLSNLQDQAAQLGAQGAGLSSYIQSGTLPAGMQAALDRQTKASQAAIRSKYASAGMSGSSAEITDLNNAAQEAQTQAFQFADSLLQQGINETGLSSRLYESILQINQQQNQETGSAIASLAAALAGGGGGGNSITLKAA